MKKQLLVLLIGIATSSIVSAQQFIKKASVEYEVKANIKKTMGNNGWDEMLKDAMGQFKIAYYSFTFSDNKSIYKFDHWQPGLKIPDFIKKNDEENQWFFDHSNNLFAMQKMIVGTNFIVADSIPKIAWKITNESMVIAGFNCRKAVGIIQDSVYVFAFYTDEIMISGGPCSINGLPGLIMGMTIPRMYTSWIATKISLNGVPVKDIKAPESKKPFTFGSLQSTITERTKEWFSYGSDDDEAKKQKQQFLWGIML